jgi:uncharacterized membrane protein (DUF2068 family)
MTQPDAFASPHSAGPTSPGNARRPNSPGHGDTILVIIGIFKLAKALLLLLLGLTALRLVHRDLAAIITGAVHYIHADPKGKWINWLLSRTLQLSPNRLRELGVALFIYSALFLTEGLGLVLRQHWAEYFSTISTGLFIPLELFEIGRHLYELHRVSPTPVYLTAINIAIVVYLIVRLRREAGQRRAEGRR